ncbi:MAG TPA: GDSL-type esterase/lipase family protein, partial [Polyangiaceae bacterium]|nr:GDSL-type esterase/lipase family protein [Polyangiaceae bacterium]
ETESASASPRDVLCSRPVRAILSFLAFAVLLDGVPRMKRWHLFGVEPPGQSAQPPQSTPASPLSIGETSLKEESQTSDDGRAESEASHATSAARGPIAKAEVNDAPLINVDTKAPPIAIEDPSGRALVPFFSRLSATMAKQSGAITRIVHFGDSVVASDYVSGTLRRRFQEQFGDSGHGFTLLANAWPAYFHEGVTRFATSGWLISRVVGPLADDGWHGLGGVSFKAPPHLLARIGTAKKGDVGRKVSRFVLMYVESPDGGMVNIKLDGVAQSALDTSGPKKQFRTSTYSAPDGEHELELQTVKGTSRFFGVVLERDQPGVVLDAIGIQGARIRFLDKQDDAHYKEQLLWRDPALVIYQFGANESADGYAYSMADYHQTMKAVVEQQRAALPNASCLILGAMDRATRKGDEIRSLTIIPLLVAQQRKVAFEVGCAFFDTFRAMGGPGSMPNWFRRDLGQSDLAHPTAVGAEVIGNWIYRALMQAGKGQAVTVAQ